MSKENPHTNTHSKLAERACKGAPNERIKCGAPTNSFHSVSQVSQSVECWVSSSVVRVCECRWATYILREDKKHARARRGAQSSREIPTHVEPRVIEQKERPTPTQHHTRTHTPQAKHVCTRPTPPRTHRTTTEQRKPTHDYTHSELAERACKGAPQ